MLHTNCHTLHFTLPSDAKIQKNAVDENKRITVLNRLTSGSNVMCEWYGCVLDRQLVKNVIVLIIRSGTCLCCAQP